MAETDIKPSRITNDGNSLGETMIMTYAEAERIAREAAHAIPEMDHASTRAIEAVAYLLVEAYRRGAADARSKTRRRLFPELPAARPGA